MNHKVNNVQELHDDAFYLYNNLVVGGESSADAVLHNLEQAVLILKNNWKGIDAGRRIQEVIKVYNAMTVVRNALASLAVDSSKVAVNYREIQNINGAGLPGFTSLSYETKSILADYHDTADTVDINPAAENGKNFIDTANNCLEMFSVSVRGKYDEIMENWLAGTGRDSAEDAFDSFVSSVNLYKQTLSDVSNNIKIALQNYNF